MKIRRMPVAVALALTTLVLLPQAHAQATDSDSKAPTAQELKQDTEALAEKLKHYSADQRDQAAQSIRETLREFDAGIDRLSRKLSKNWDSMSEKSRRQTQKQLDELRAQRAKVGKWYQRLEDSSSSAWDSMKKGFSNAYKGLSEAWGRARKKLDDGQDQPTQRQHSI